MNRRGFLRWGASVATVPAAAVAQQQHDHPPVPNLAKAKPPAPDPDWNPAFFNPHQNETVIAVSDAIIPTTDTPGAKAALVNRYMDKLLSAAPPEEQNRFTRDLAALDQFATRSQGAAFANCTAAQQTAVLTALSSGKDAEGRRVFQNLKGMTSRVYYATEQGFQDLNKGGRVPGTFACQDAEHR